MFEWDAKKAALNLAKHGVSFDEGATVLADAEALDGPDVQHSGWKVGGKMFACLAVHRSAAPDSLAIRIDFDQRDELMAADPNTYYLTDHYVNYPVVLVRLTRVHPDALRDLLMMAWRFVSTSGKRRGGQRKRK